MDAEAGTGTVPAMFSSSLRIGQTTLRVTCLVALFAMSGCGGAVTHVQSSPFTSEDATLFDQGISYLALNREGLHQPELLIFLNE